MRTPMPCSSSSRATAVPAWPAPKMTTSSHLAGARRDQLAPGLGGLRRADDDDPVARADLVVAARDDDVVAADDARHPGVGR